MMDINQIAGVLGVSRNTAKRIVEYDGFAVIERMSPGKRRKFYYEVTPEILIEIKNRKDPECVLRGQDESLRALEMAFFGVKPNNTKLTLGKL